GGAAGLSLSRHATTRRGHRRETRRAHCAPPSQGRSHRPLVVLSGASPPAEFSRLDLPEVGAILRQGPPPSSRPSVHRCNVCEALALRGLRELKRENCPITPLNACFDAGPRDGALLPTSNAISGRAPGASATGVPAPRGNSCTAVWPGCAQRSASRARRSDTGRASSRTAGPRRSARGWPTTYRTNLTNTSGNPFNFRGLALHSRVLTRGG